jgi:hypothetical protein
MPAVSFERHIPPPIGTTSPLVGIVRSRLRFVFV